MTKPRHRTMTPAAIWIDHDQAIISITDADGDPAVERLDRGAIEAEVAFEARAVDEVVGHAPVSVSGPAFARTSFERVFTTMTHEPERLVDIGPGIESAAAADLPARR